MDRHTQLALDIRDFISESLEKQKPQNALQYDNVIHFACFRYADIHNMELIRKKTANLIFYDPYYCIKVDPNANPIISPIKLDRITVDFYDSIVG